MFCFLCKKIGSFFFWISKKTFIIGVVQESVETALNSSGDVFLRLWQRSSIGRNTLLLMAARMPPNETAGMTFRTIDDVFVGRLSHARNKGLIYQDGYM